MYFNDFFSCPQSPSCFPRAAVVRYMPRMKRKIGVNLLSGEAAEQRCAVCSFSCCPALLANISLRMGSVDTR